MQITLYLDCPSSLLYPAALAQLGAEIASGLSIPASFFQNITLLDKDRSAVSLILASSVIGESISGPSGNCPDCRHMCSLGLAEVLQRQVGQKRSALFQAGGYAALITSMVYNVIDDSTVAHRASSPLSRGATEDIVTEIVIGVVVFFLLAAGYLLSRAWRKCRAPRVADDFDGHWDGGVELQTPRDESSAASDDGSEARAFLEAVGITV